eukprot:scaffold15118_cov94-Skeletonema_marinoi.AAC.2
MEDTICHQGGTPSCKQEQEAASCCGDECCLQITSQNSRNLSALSFLTVLQVYQTISNNTKRSNTKALTHPTY